MLHSIYSTFNLLFFFIQRIYSRLNKVIHHLKVIFQIRLGLLLSTYTSIYSLLPRIVTVNVNLTLLTWLFISSYRLSWETSCRNYVLFWLYLYVSTFLSPTRVHWFRSCPSAILEASKAFSCSGCRWDTRDNLSGFLLGWDSLVLVDWYRCSSPTLIDFVLNS